MSERCQEEVAKKWSGRIRVTMKIVVRVVVTKRKVVVVVVVLVVLVVTVPAFF